MRKKALSWLLAVSMILSLFVSMPITAAAGVLPGAVFSDGDLDRVYFSGDTLTFNLSGLPVGTPPTGIPAGTALRVSLGIVDASSTFTDYTLFNTSSLTSEDPNYVFNGMGDNTGWYLSRTLNADGTLSSTISGTIVTTPPPTLGVAAVKIYVNYGSVWQNFMDDGNPATPDFIPLTAEGKDAIVGLDGILEMPDGVTSDPVIGTLAQTAEDLRSLDISFTKTIAMDTTGTIAFTGLNLLDNSSELADLDDGIIMSQATVLTPGTTAQYTLGVDTDSLAFLAGIGATISATSASFDGYQTSDFEAVAADVTGGLVSDLAFDDATDTVSFIVNHFSNYTLSVLENESELFYEDFESYTENTYPSSFTQQYNGTGDANQKIITTETFNGSTGKVFQLEGAPSWSSTQYVGLPSTLPNNLVIDAYIKPVTTSRNAELALSNFGVGPWGTRISSVWFEGDGTIVAVQKGDDNDRISIGTYNVGQWYRVTLDNDMIAKTYDVYVDGVLMASNIPMHPTVTPTALSIYAHNVTFSVAYYDNVGIYAELPDFDISSSDSSVIVANTNNSSVDFFDIQSNGDIAPLRTIKGANTNLNRPVDVALYNDELYVLNHEVHSIEVFDPYANGDITPIDRITGGFTGSMFYPSGFDFDAETDEIYVANYGAQITVYNTSDSGAVAPKRHIAKVNTMTLAVSGDELFVTTYTEPVVYVYNKTTGAQLRTISGANTGFSSQLYGLAVIGADLYIADSANNSIKVFNTTDSGDVAPKRVISGSNTLLGTPRELHISGDKLYVANNNSTVTVYNLNANGDAQPLQVLSGPLTSFNAIQGVTTADVDTEPLNICAVVDTGTGTVLNEYTTLDLALNAVLSGQTIKLLTDITHNSTIASDNAGFNLNLDLNGKSLTVNSSVFACLFANNGGDINITDDIGGGMLITNATTDIALRADAGGTIMVNAPLTINATSTNSRGIYAYGGSVTVTDAEINSKYRGVESYGVYKSIPSSINVTGNITTSGDWAEYGAYAYSGGIVEIIGNVACSNEGVFADSNGRINVTGDVTAQIDTGVHTAGGTITVDGNVLTNGASYSAWANGGTIDITGNASTYGSGSDTLHPIGTYAVNNGSITVGGDVNATGTGCYGAEVHDSSSIKIDGVINATTYVNIGGGVLPVGNTYEPTTLPGYYTYAYASELSNVVWVKNHALAVEDTWISEAYPADINGANPTLETGITVSEGSSGYALVRFDVSSLPDSAEVIKLQLRFSGISSAGGHLSKVTAHKVTSAWDEDNVSYSTKPTWDSTIIDTFDGTIFGTGYIGAVWEWDITELYNQWKENPSTNFGVLLSAPIPFVDLYASQGFYSKEGAPDDVYAPRLVFEESTCIVPGCTDPHADGAFTESEMIMGVEYYHISTAEQLAHINEHLDLNYIQTADIDLAQYNGGLWNPIGGNLGYEAFSGRYMGNSKQITNMTIDTSSTDGSILYAGLFGLTSADAHIEGINLTINSMSAVQDNEGYGRVYLGGITAMHESQYTIEDCHVTINGNLTATSYGGDVFVGGITGYNTGNITDCSTTTGADSTITVAAPGEEAFVGGIAGYTSGNILNSDNAGKIRAEADAETYTLRVYVGGIAGYASTSSTNTVIENCENNADIESINFCAADNTYRAYAGGIVGHIYFENPQVVEITNCANVGADKQVYTRAPSTMTGGIAGSSRFTQAVCTTIKNCYNRSDVISEMLDFDYNKKVPTFCTGVTAGGTIGAAGGIKIWYSYSTAANVSATAMPNEDAYEGGIAGLIYDTILLENYYETNSNIAAGVGGTIDGSMNIIPQADLAGEVEAATKAQLQTKSFFGDGWQWYLSGGTAPDYYDSTAPWRMTAANTYPVLKGAAYTEPTPPSGGGGSYTPSTYNIIATANTGGTITPNGSSAVTEYSNLKFTIKPDANYAIQDVLVDGKSVGAVSEYTFSSVKANHTIEAKFAHDCPSKPFIDVDITQWYHEGIDYVLLEDLFKGTSATTFEPNTSMTRAMLVTVLYRLEGTPAAAIGNPFSDVASGNWYADAVVWANAKGIVKGYDSDTFGTNDFITREQLATILYRYAQYKGYDVSVGEDTNILSYEDAFNISEYAIPAVQWACGAGIMQGDAAKLDPQGNATRAQVAAMLMRFIENVVK